MPTYFHGGETFVPITGDIALASNTHNTSTGAVAAYNWIQATTNAPYGYYINNDACTSISFRNINFSADELERFSNLIESLKKDKCPEKDSVIEMLE